MSIQLDDKLKLRFTKPYEDLIQVLDDIAETKRICSLKVRDQEYLLFVEKVD